MKMAFFQNQDGAGTMEAYQAFRMDITPTVNVDNN